MANIRDLKKDINNLCFEVISECVIFQKYSSSLFFENVQEIIVAAVELRNDLITRVNNPPLNEESKAIKAHYKSVVDDLYEKTIAMVERLNALPEELQETEKAPLKEVMIKTGEKEEEPEAKKTKKAKE